MVETIYNIRPAQPADANSIVAIFEAAYNDYPDQVYRNPDELAQVINLTDATEIFVIELSNKRSNLTQTSIIGTGSIRYTDDNDVAELCKAAIDPAYQGLRHASSGQSAYQSLLTTRIDSAYDTGAKILRTKANSSAHAITQREHHKQGFVPVGVSKGRYREVFSGKGREDIVFMMDSASMHRPFGKSDTVTLHLHPDCIPFVEYVIDTFQTTTGHALQRTIKPTRSIWLDQQIDEWMFSFDKTIDRHENLSIECSVYPSDGGMSLEAIVDEIEHLISNSEFKFASVALNANHPSAAVLWSKLNNLGFHLEAFEPDLLRKDGINDRLRLQRPPEETSKAQFIDPALELLDRQSIGYRIRSDPEPIPVSDVTAVVL